MWTEFCHFLPHPPAWTVFIPWAWTKTDISCPRSYWMPPLSFWVFFNVKEGNSNKKEKNISLSFILSIFQIKEGNSNKKGGKYTFVIHSEYFSRYSYVIPGIFQQKKENFHMPFRIAAIHFFASPLKSNMCHLSMYLKSMYQTSLYTEKAVY